MLDNLESRGAGGMVKEFDEFIDVQIAKVDDLLSKLDARQGKLMNWK